MIRCVGLLFAFNFAIQVRDAYLHTNCLATLANMAPHMTNVHPACAERLMALLRILSRKLNKLCRDVTPAPQPQPQQQNSQDGLQPMQSMQQQSSAAYLNPVAAQPPLSEEALAEKLQEIATFSELIRVLLESIYICASRFQLKIVFFFVSPCLVRWHCQSTLEFSALILIPEFLFVWIVSTGINPQRSGIGHASASSSSAASSSLSGPPVGLGGGASDKHNLHLIYCLLQQPEVRNG